MWVFLLPLDFLILAAVLYALPALFVAALWVAVVILAIWVLFIVVRAAIRSARA